MQADELFFDPFYVSINGITYPTYNLGKMADRLIKPGKREEAEQLRTYNGSGICVRAVIKAKYSINN